jgi:capsid protein
LRLLPIDPRRLVQPADRAQASRTNLGIKRTKQGKPLTYYIADESGRGSSDSISARNMIHQFEIKEPGQARGIPWLASVLQVIADLRDYDAEVLDAARQATYWAIALTTTHPNVDPLVQSETTEIEKRTIATMPPGWNATPMTPPQPSTNYVDYRGERMRDIGRPRQMPAMLVRLDSSKHNYSSARFDSQMYNRGNSRSQAWFERNTLNALVEDVTREGELTKAISAKRPEFFELFWIWPKPPHVDPVKEALAERIRLKNRTLSLTDALAVHNKDFDAHVEQLKTEEEAFEEAGVALNLEGSSSQTARPRSDGANNMVRDLVVDLFGQEIAKRVLNKTNGKANGHPGRIQHVNS